MSYMDHIYDALSPFGNLKTSVPINCNCMLKYISLLCHGRNPYTVGLEQHEDEQIMTFLVEFF